MKIKNAKDFWSGVMFVAFGVFFAGFARQYDMGTAARMGPAYFPTVLGLLLVAIGLYVGFKGLRLESEDGDGAVGKFHFKPLLLVLGGVSAFGVLLRPAGMVIAISAMIVIASLGSGEFKWKEIIPLTVGLAVLVLVVFIWGLSMTIPIFPAFMQN
jgi:hypothetical protein